MLAKLAASGQMLPSGEVAAALSEMQGRVEEYVPAPRLAKALLKRAWESLRGRRM